MQKGAHTGKVPGQVVQIFCLRSLGNNNLAGPVYFTGSRRASEAQTQLKKQANVKASCFFSVANECLSFTLSSIFLITGRLIATRSNRQGTHSAYGEQELIIPLQLSVQTCARCLLQHMLHANQVMTACSLSKIIFDKCSLLQ